MLLGAPSSGAGGGETSDLGKATTLVAAMISALGLDEEQGLLWIGPIAGKGLTSCYAGGRTSSGGSRHCWRRLMSTPSGSHRPAVEAVADLLVARETAGGAEIEPVIARAAAHEKGTEACGVKAECPTVTKHGNISR